eukprot:CAMPEP_0183290882 /NCGR_PEP_ID=MMETSP0160_2-20130417/464_1 /TAXON_ID=2839 ORGANISM="Odontella Sinensis, Strain Grunow 1884" /NCGR_SAMPLE_ID=MMETSP0160_2 /ASSEMBLY_ACC=CAM_ASM_000250 /LENGTH=293 /DNA_ID=CAMNT_0025451581 /DNA_START=62 /DNA_END=943 /DNA_ORIENTATION=+
MSATTATRAVFVRVGSVLPSADLPTDSPAPINVTNRDDLSSCLSSAGIAPSSLDSIDVTVSASDLVPARDGGRYDPLAIAGWVPHLRPEGKVSVRVTEVQSGTDMGPVNTSFVLAGLAPESESRGEDGSRVLTARKRAGDEEKRKKATASAPLRLRIDPPVEEKKTADRVTLDDLDDDDIIDEDDLLAAPAGGGLSAPPEVDLEARAAALGADDCGGRTACDNCTCGRAEKEASEKAVAAKGGDHNHGEGGHESHCGNCFKGDAFRCASCPHLGKPAFKPEEEHLVLDLTDDI